jgi:hypothetical protein
MMVIAVAWAPESEAALLCFLRVKHRLLNLRPRDQNVDPPDHSLIGDLRRDGAVMLNRAVEFDALFGAGRIRPLAISKQAINAQRRLSGI